jgi:hypothetical protein
VFRLGGHSHPTFDLGHNRADYEKIGVFDASRSIFAMNSCRVGNVPVNAGWRSGLASPRRMGVLWEFSERCRLTLGRRRKHARPMAETVAHVRCTLESGELHGEVPDGGAFNDST